jgi:hypothetical protein
MSSNQSQNGLSNLIGLGIIALILGSVIYSVWGTTEPQTVEQPVEQPQVIQQEQPSTTSSAKIMENWKLGDGKLGLAQPLSASDLGKAKPISGGGISGFSGGGGGSTSTTKTASTPKTTTPPRSGG